MPVKLKGATSGDVTLDVPAAAGTNTLILPAKTGNLITDADSATVTPTMLSQKLTLMTSQATTSGTSIDFTSIPSWAKRITLMFSGVSLSASAHILVQIGTGGTPTATGYTAGTTALANAAVTNSTSTTGFNIFAGTATYAQTGSLVIANFSGNSWVASGTCYNTVTTAFSTTSAGVVTLSGVLNMVRITTSNGTDTFDAGAINILYEG